jgi:hypothetical protein
MLLRREQPEQITAAYSVLPVSEQICSRAMRHKVQLELCVMMPTVGSCGISVGPRHAIDVFREFEPLKHADKK